MTLEEILEKLHSPTEHAIKLENGELTALLEELKELREQNAELKSILNAALKDIHGKHICEVMNAAKLCAMKFQQLCDIFPWQYANEALKLIGGAEDENS